MARYDISCLRKENGMSQNELANLLQMTQSFLSAIENGKSPLPMEKEDRLCEIFGIQSLNPYIIDKAQDSDSKKIAEMTDSDLFNQLLSRFHKQAHSEESEHHHHDHHQRIDDLQQNVNDLAIRNESLLSRNDALMLRNDKLSDDNDRLRAEIDSYRKEIEKLRSEIFQLKLQLLKFQQ